MNKSPIHDLLCSQFRTLKMDGAYECYIAQLTNPHYAEIEFEERLSEVLQAQIDAISKRRTCRLIKQSRVADPLPDACRITYEPERNLKKNVVQALCDGYWLDSKEHTWVAITGASGTGKTFLAKAILISLLRKGHRGIYYETTEFLDLLQVSRRNGQQTEFRRELGKYEVLVLDDFNMTSAEEITRLDLLAVLRDRFERSALIITSQYRDDDWYELISGKDAALNDAIMDRLIHGSYKVNLEGPSLRERRSNAIIRERSDQ